MQYDVIIIGGSYAGLAAAMPLARARRKILIIDDRQRRNRFAQHSHGFLTQDGTEAAEIAKKGKEQLQAYGTVDWLNGKVTSTRQTERGFHVDIDGMATQEARRLVLATGVIDRLPEVSGLTERWGTQVFHCPYCHGYELNRGQIGILATSSLSMHLAMILPDWGPTTFFLNGMFEPDDEQLAKLAARAVKIENSAIDRIEGKLDLHLKDGRIVPLDGLFVTTRVEDANPFAALLGCEFDEGPYGYTIKTDPMKSTTVQGVYACGDIARLGGSLPLAVGDGTIAGAAAHQSLIFGNY